MFKALLVVLTMAYVGHASATTAVPTNIVNLDKAEFVGSLVLSNMNSQAVNNLKPTPVSFSRGFRTLEDCNEWAVNPTFDFKIVGTPHSTTQASWETQSYMVLVGGCAAK